MLLYGIYSVSNSIKYGGERMNFLRYFCADWHFPVVFFREGKSDWNVLATKNTMEEKLSGKWSNITFPPNIILGTLLIYFFSGLRAFQRKDAMQLHQKATQKKQFVAAIIWHILPS